nr:hypothetical protein [Leptospira weilii]
MFSSVHQNKKFVVGDDSQAFTKNKPSTKTKSPKVKSLTAKDRFNSKFPHINIDYYTNLTKALLTNFYPKTCPTCNVLLTKEVSTRENAILCPECNYHGSRTVGTSLHHLKVPLWTFSYILVEAVQRFPLGLSASEIQRKLCVSNNTGILLKRRLQVFLSEMIPSIKALMVEDICKSWKGRNLPESGDLSKIIKGKPVVHTDTLALFSATPSMRSNGHLARKKHTGQTASIYLSDRVAEQKGKYQIGSLIHTIAIKGKGIILTSVPDQKQTTLQPLFDFLPQNAPLCSDEGIPWMERYNRNFRSVNHSARSKDGKRNVWAKNRWSKNGISNQVSEGTQRSIKYSFLASYSYFKPESGQLYLNEFSALKAIRVYGVEELLRVSSHQKVHLSSKKTKELGKVETKYRIKPNSSIKHSDSKYLLKTVDSFKYIPPTPNGRIRRDFSNSRKRIDVKFRNLLEKNEFYELRQAHIDYLDFMIDGPKHRRLKEKYFNSLSYMLWNKVNHESESYVNSEEWKFLKDRKPLIRILSRWAKLGIAKVTKVKTKAFDEFELKVQKLIPILPDVLYTYDRSDFLNYKEQSKNIKVIMIPTQVGSKSKYGLTKKERDKLIRGCNGKFQNKKKRH